ncbi:hypothetical protein MHO82_22320 [Vibrio sp. Of7-15]|uniref:hypothetical protein n=1 Tax=Vibrio sp. Of7-15 TaxID=2724879 RepID=UPI001EF29CF7|nr:hypothetical protein [Vibrio sp. Of7-15]MCG7499604.1 hypothetical protein [Vibrio sp. Of7-15]
MQEVYSYDVSLLKSFFYLIIPLIIVPIIKYKHRKTIKNREKHILSVFIIICIVGFFNSLYKNMNILWALNSNCTSKECIIVSGEVIDFKSFQGTKNYQTNQFKVGNMNFKLDEKGNSFGYGLIIEKGGIFHPGKKFKLFTLNNKIIKAYEVTD